MKIFPLGLCFLFLLLSCREEVKGWNSLTPEEQEEISNRARRNCLSSNASSYKNFLEKSNEIFQSTSFNRGKGFLHEFKLDSTLIHSTELRVWKRSSDEAYFYVTETDQEGLTDSYFLRIPKDQNEEIISQFKIDHCDEVYSSISISESGPLVVKLEYEVPVGASRKEYTDTFKFNFSKPAFFGTFEIQRKIITYDSDDTESDSKSYSSTFNTKTYEDDFSSTDFSDSDLFEQSFCEIIPESGQTVLRLIDGVSGFNNKNCTSSVPGEWDLVIE